MTDEAAKSSPDRSGVDSIVGRFASRRDVDLVIEKLVQQHGIERTDIFAKAAFAENSVGEKVDGADAESGHPGVASDANPALAGAIEVSVDVNDDTGEIVRSVMSDAGGDLITH